MRNESYERALKERQEDILNYLYDKYELLPTDFFSHKHYKIIRREGIEKIIDTEGIMYNLHCWYCDEVSCVVHGKFWIPEHEVVDETTGESVKVPEQYIETTGSANRGNTPSTYFAEIAEKRCLSRGVLKLIKAYKYAFMGEDEIDPRDEEYEKSRRNSFGKGATYKG